MLRYGALAGAAALVAFIAVSNVRDYFDWQTTRWVQEARMPGVDRCEFDMFQSLAKPAAKKGGLPDTKEFNRQRLILACTSLNTGEVNE